MGRHHEQEPERARRGGLRWKGDTTGSIPVIPDFVTHSGITDETVDTFLAAMRASAPPDMEAEALDARYQWLVERRSDVLSAGEHVRHDVWVRVGTGYTQADYPSNYLAAVDMLLRWFLWNGVVDPSQRSLHTIWIRHATESTWTERLDG